jgi:O-antigen/teichoic acid export membrane protein
MVKRLAYFFGLYAGSTVILKGAGFALSMWMARTLSVPEFGSWGLLYAAQTALATFSMIGIIEAVVALLRQHDAPPARQSLFAAANAVFFRTMMCAMTFAVLAVSLYLILGGVIKLSTLPGALASGALLAFAALQAQIVRLDERHFVSVLYSFFVPLAGLVGSAVAVGIDRSAASFFVGSTGGLAIALAVLHRRQKVVDNSFTNKNSRELIFARLAPYIAVTFFGWLSGYGNNFVIGALFESAEVAKFTFVLSVGSVIQLVATALNQVWSPRFYQIAPVQPFDVVERKNRNFYGLLSFVLGCVGASLIMLLQPVLRVIGGNLLHYESLELELFFVVAGYVFLSPWWHCANYFLLYDKGSNMMYVTLVTSAIGLAVWFAAMWAIGPIGIFFGFFFQMVIRSIGIVYVGKKFWPLTISWTGVGAGMLAALGGLLIAKI